ncbi:translation initiation factor IF-3 [Candidatus Parcubacteria bacterium]|nr:translation initiation factor IF-3 [Candidatus Parcubacteria bacterium]
MAEKIRINRQIFAKELRVIDSEGANLGLLPLEEALRRAEEKRLDLIEISPNAVPPIAKIMDYGKFQYGESKKQKERKQKSHTSELKTIQVKIGTGEHDLAIKAKNASAWLKEGHRIKVDLFLTGRAKYMEESFLRERLERLLHLLSENYRVAEDYKRGPKGLSILIERAK